MSYIDLLDRKKSIQAARHEMNHFSDLYKLHEFKDNYEIGGGTGNDSIISIINCLNYDAKEINKIKVVFPSVLEKNFPKFSIKKTS